MWVQIELPQPAMIAGVQFESPAALVDTTPAVPGAPTRTGIGGGRGGPAPQPAFPRGYEVVVSTDGTTWSNPGRARSGEGGRERDRVPADAREVRADPPDRHRRERALDAQAVAGPGSAGCGAARVYSDDSRFKKPRRSSGITCFKKNLLLTWPLVMHLWRRLSVQCGNRLHPFKRCG